MSAIWESANWDSAIWDSAIWDATDGKAIAIFRYFVIIILYCKSIHSVIFFNKIHFL